MCQRHDITIAFYNNNSDHSEGSPDIENVHFLFSAYPSILASFPMVGVRPPGHSLIGITSMTAEDASRNSQQNS
jgi:hypothetical protein